MKNKGFTLTEMLIVIAIIGILCAAAAPLISDNADSKKRFRNTSVNNDSGVAVTNVSKCEKVGDGESGAVHKCPDGTVLLVK